MKAQFIELTKENMEAAISRAKSDKPFVRATGERTYEVNTRKEGATVHTVEFQKANGKKLGSCDCPHFIFRGTPCRHLAASVGFHIQRMSNVGTRKGSYVRAVVPFGKDWSYQGNVEWVTVEGIVASVEVRRFNSVITLESGERFSSDYLAKTQIQIEESEALAA